MTKQELVALVERINAIWGPQADVDPKVVLETWWHFLGDLDAFHVSRALDSFALQPQSWRPKPGEVRVRTIDGTSPWPDADTAFQMAQEARARADSGLAPLGGDESLWVALGRAMRQPGSHSKAGFTAAWTAITAERYAVPFTAG